MLCSTLRRSLGLEIGQLIDPLLQFCACPCDGPVSGSRVAVTEGIRARFLQPATLAVIYRDPPNVAWREIFKNQGARRRARFWLTPLIPYPFSPFLESLLSIMLFTSLLLTILLPSMVSAKVYFGCHRSDFACTYLYVQDYFSVCEKRKIYPSFCRRGRG